MLIKSTTFQNYLKTTAGSSFKTFQTLNMEAIEQGLIRPEYSDADLVAQVFWSAVHGVASLQITKAQHSWIRWTGLEPLATAVVDGILRGMTDPKSEISNLKSQISHEGVAS